MTDFKQNKHTHKDYFAIKSEAEAFLSRFFTFNGVQLFI